MWLTLSSWSSDFNHRRILVCHDIDDAVEALHTLEAQRVFTHYQQPCNRPTVFMFPGQGAQYVNMGRELYHSEPNLLRKLIVAAESKTSLGVRFTRYSLSQRSTNSNSYTAIKTNFYYQSALFVIEYALSKLWMAWGVLPEAMIGHSLGEYVAATLSGVFSSTMLWR